jgi:5,10-methylenetetrahydromethanopterin reductase
MVEFWRAGGSVSGSSAAQAQAVEAEGWDGQMFMDSQSLSADPFVLMGAWAVTTTKLKLCTGVTNPGTRHPAVLAANIASVQSLSNGRAVLGIGRGDSALAYLGHAPVSLPAFRTALTTLQTLLSGEETEFGSQALFADAPSAETLSLGARPAAMRLKWLPDFLPKVPLDVAATGPKIIEMAAQLAERITFSVGAIPERLAWALDIARRAGGSRNLSYGAQIIVVCHPDIEAVRAAATSFVAPLARFQIIQSQAAGPQTENDAANFAALRSSYDMTKHDHVISHDKLKGAQLDWDFVQRFAIVGPPAHCIERLLDLAALGIERFVVVGPGFHPEASASGRSLFADVVMPAVRARLSGQKS